VRRGLISSAVLAIAVASGGPTASANDIVGILHVDVKGVSETAAEMFENSLENGLGNAGFQVARRDRMAQMLEPSGYVEGCLIGPCVQKVFKITGVRLLLVARITGVGKNFSFIVTLIDSRTGMPTSQAAERCAVCTLDEAIATASLAVIGLVTGAGGTTITDPAVGPTGATLDPAEVRAQAAQDRKLLAARKRSVMRGAIFFVGMAALSGAVSVYMYARDDNDVAYPAAAAAGAFALSGFTGFAIAGGF
jgi:hypothetical protein